MREEYQGEYLYLVFTARPGSVELSELEMALCTRVVDTKNREGHVHLRDAFIRDKGNKMALSGGAIVPLSYTFMVMENSDDVDKVSLTREQFLDVFQRRWFYDGTKWLPQKPDLDLNQSNVHYMDHEKCYKRP